MSNPNATTDRLNLLNRLSNRAAELTAQADDLISKGRADEAMPLLTLADSYRSQAATFSRIQWETDDIALRTEAIVQQLKR